MSSTSVFSVLAFPPFVYKYAQILSIFNKSLSLKSASPSSYHPILLIFFMAKLFEKKQFVLSGSISLSLTQYSILCNMVSAYLRNHSQ